MEKKDIFLCFFVWTLSCVGIYIDDFSVQDGFMVICPHSKHY